MKYIVDGHCDTLSKVLDEKSSLYDSKYSFNFYDADKKKPYIQMLAAFVSPKYVDNNLGGFSRACNILDDFKEYKNDKNIKKVWDKEDLDYVLNNEKIGALLTIENGSAISGNIENVNVLYDKGVRVMGITWNEDNDLGSGALTKCDSGLTDLGKEYIKKLDNKGIIVDVSHASERTFWDVANTTMKTFVATHSCVYNLCNHSRNLKDEQIKEIASRGGIIGLCFVSKFLSNEGNASISDVIEHIKYIRRLVGIDYVGIGSDFDGVDLENMPKDLKCVNDFKKLELYMKNESFTEEEINKVFGENWIRVLMNSL